LKIYVFSLQHAIPLSQQLKYFKEYQGKLAKVAGSKKAALIIKDALYILSAGSSDFVQNYYVNPIISKALTPDQYSAYLVGAFSIFVKVFYFVTVTVSGKMSHNLIKTEKDYSKGALF